jgi:hypothetical protein
MASFDRGRRRGARRVTLVAVAGALLLAQAFPAAALDVTRSNDRRVLGDLRAERLTITLDDGRIARGELLRFPEQAPDLKLRPRLANGVVTGLQTMEPMARNEFAKGAIAGTNGGYFIQRPSGNPNGLHVQDGRLVGSNGSAGGGGLRPRSALGIGPSGQLVFDQLEVDKTLTIPGGRVPVRFTNRELGTGSDVVLYTTHYGRSFPVPADSTLIVVTELRAGSSGRTANDVINVVRPRSDTSASVAPGTSVVLVNRSGVPSGSADEAALAALAPGDRVGLETTIRPRGTDPARWNTLSGALPGGGTLLRDGAIPSLAEWTSEAFSDSHFTLRRARTAMGRRPNGEALLLTIDENSPTNTGWSSGVSGRELAQVFQRLGATEAVNLDGGGSTTMTIAGTIRNRPSDPPRGHATGLFVYAPLPPASRDLRQHACPVGQAPPSGFGDTAGNTHATAIDCLVWWQVAGGRSADRYDPRAPVRRQEMATMLAKLITVAAESGAGRPLPASAPNPFTDVAEDNVHARNIARLAAAGVVRGTSTTTFAPDAVVRRDQVASMVASAYEYSIGRALPAGRDTFMDDNGNTHEGAINRLAQVGVIGGTGGYSYSPAGSVRRDAMASFVMRSADLLAAEGVVQPPS